MRRHAYLYRYRSRWAAASAGCARWTHGGTMRNENSMAATGVEHHLRQVRRVSSAHCITDSSSGLRLFSEAAVRSVEVCACSARPFLLLPTAARRTLNCISVHEVHLNRFASADAVGKAFEMSVTVRPLRIGFVHPDLGIGLLGLLHFACCAQRLTSSHHAPSTYAPRRRSRETGR